MNMMAMKNQLTIRQLPWRVTMVIGAIVLLAIVAVYPGRAVAEAASIDAVMELHAKDLHKQLERKYKNSSGLGRKVAIWPYAPDEQLPIAHKQARELNDRLLSALQRLPGSKYDFRARRELRAVMRELDETGGGSDDPADLVQRHISADILIQGQFYIEGEQIKSNYKAIALRKGQTGSILATSKTRSLPLGSGTQSFQLNQFFQHAARRFRNDASEMTELHLGGVRFQNS